MSLSNQLPGMPTLIQNLMRDSDSDHDPNNTEDCSICADRLFNNPHNENGIVVRMPPCHHLFHSKCIIDSLHSISATHNLCPNCRAPLCQLNLLSPGQEAARQADEAERNDAMADFHTAAYARIMMLTDNCFNWQWTHFKPTDREDYIRIVGEVCQAWAHEATPGFRVCHDHVRMGWDWFEYVVARRIKARLQQVGALNTPRGQWFIRYLDVIVDNLDEDEDEIDARADYDHDLDSQASYGDSENLPMASDQDLMQAALLGGAEAQNQSSPGGEGQA
jgi:hypothetical protein